MGGLDCLINNASIFEKDDISNFNSKSWEKHIGVNLKISLDINERIFLN